MINQQTRSVLFYEINWYSVIVIILIVFKQRSVRQFTFNGFMNFDCDLLWFSAMKTASMIKSSLVLGRNYVFHGKIESQKHAGEPNNFYHQISPRFGCSTITRRLWAFFSASELSRLISRFHLDRECFRLMSRFAAAEMDAMRKFDESMKYQMALIRRRVNI